MRRLTLLSIPALLLLSVALAASAPIHAQGGTFYVAPDGVNAPARGGAAAPWATIGYALGQVPDGSTILVRPGDYSGQVRLDASFAAGVTVRAEVPYQARLRHTGQVVLSYYGQGITLEGFDIAHSGPGAGALVIQIQNLRDEGVVSRITLRNNIIHDSYNNDILKINNGATGITVSGNLFYNQSGSDEHMDINSVTDVIVEDNIFFNDFAGSGRANNNDTSAYVVIKDSNGNDDNQLGSEHITIRRNIFLNWQGSAGYGFVQIGEDATANYEADGVLIENNLLLGNSLQRMRSPFGVMGSQNVTIRNNTVVGDLPANAFTMRLYRIEPNQPNANIRLFNNIWADPAGTMGSFSDTPQGATASFTLGSNLYWNGGEDLPGDPSDMVNAADDAAALLGDPLLGAQAGLVLPRWVQGSGQFADGSATIRAAFERLANSYGTPGAGSPARDSALAAEAPADDLLGNRRPRNGAPDRGAVEAQQGTPPPTLDERLLLPLLCR